MSSRLSERMSAARRSSFVGRTAEQAQFRSALEAEALPFNILHIYGPGGVGKTTLLKQFADLCAEVGAAVVMLDARNLETSPAAFRPRGWRWRWAWMPTTTHSITWPTGMGAVWCWWTLMKTWSPWMNGCAQIFSPTFPRTPWWCWRARFHPTRPGAATQAGGTLVQVMALRNLAPEESRTFLDRRAMPEDQHAPVMDVHPRPPAGAFAGCRSLFAQRPGFRIYPCRRHPRYYQGCCWSNSSRRCPDRPTALRWSLARWCA